MYLLDKTEYVGGNKFKFLELAASSQYQILGTTCIQVPNLFIQEITAMLDSCTGQYCHII